MKNCVTDGLPLKPGPYYKNHGDKTNCARKLQKITKKIKKDA